ncbi:MAG: proton-conducting transporter membrane subunit [Patescibacteria group bacterium]
MALTLPAILVLVCLGLTLLSAVIAWIKKGQTATVALILGAFGCAAGLIGSGFALLQHTTITISFSPLFFQLPFVLDGLSQIFFFLLNLVGCLACLYALPYLKLEQAHYDAGETVAKTALFIFGMQGVLLATTPLAFLFFWEVMSLASFFLVLADRSEGSIRAALCYLVMTHLGAGALFAGFGLLGNEAFFTSFQNLPLTLSSVSPTVLSVSFALFFFGFASKAGLVPFHIWLPEAHPAAPSHISALMSGVMLKMAVYGFLRVMIILLPFAPASWGGVVLALGLLSAVYGVLYAIVERDIKRMLAYSSIENLGLIFVGIGIFMIAASQQMYAIANVGLAAALLLTIAHTLFKSGLFFTAGAIVSQVHSRSLELMGGLAKRMPSLSMAALVLILAAAALPPFGAFIGEWTLMQGMIEALGTGSPLMRLTLLITLVLMAFVGGLAVFAMGKLFGIAFLAAPRSERAENATEPHILMLIPVWILAALSLFIGVGSPWILRSIGFNSYVQTSGVITVGNTGLQPLVLAGVFVVCLLVSFLLRRLLSNSKLERAYHTWDCGQPINAGMEYTATAFSGPIRFFFRTLLRTKKTITATPLLATNPWMAKRTFTLDIRSFWTERLYQPIGTALFFVSSQLRRVQSGVIQWYIALILLTLVLTLAVAIPL